MDRYLTIRAKGHGEYEEKKSRFLGEAIPVQSEEDVARHLERIRKQYYDARHHCYAYVIGKKSELKRASDDGEPSGTAGQPILKVIEAGSGITNVLIVVTRYFGGTLLGTGGLVRSYTQAAQLALADAGIVCMQEGVQLALTMEYSLLDKVNYLIGKAGLKIGDTIYTDKVQIILCVPMDALKHLEEQLTAAGSGSIQVETLEQGYYAFDTDAI